MCVSACVRMCACMYVCMCVFKCAPKALHVRLLQPLNKMWPLLWLRCVEDEDGPKEPPADEFDEILRREHELDERQMERDWWEELRRDGAVTEQ